MKMASVRFGSLWDFLIGKEKTRSTNLIMLYQVYPNQSQVCCRCAAGQCQNRYFIKLFEAKLKTLSWSLLACKFKFRDLKLVLGFTRS